MKHVGIFEAKTNLSSLVDEAEKGQEIIITRHGKPVAKLVTYAPQPDADMVEKRKRALLELREMARKRKTRTSLKMIKSWIDEGRP